MDNTSTRISDLPTNNGNIPNTGGVGGGGGLPPTISVSNNGYDKSDSMANTYVPINTHPNPYGISTQNPIMTTPQQGSQSGFPPSHGQAQGFSTPQQQPQYISEEQRMALNQQPSQRLPSRDMGHDTTGYSQDEQIKPNYIPKSNVSSDYVRDYEDMTEKNLREYEEKKRKENRLDAILTELQTPIFIAILFLLFQLPIINTMIFKRFSFLSIHSEDGNFNFYGLIFKSLMFGSAYYSLSKMTTFLGEF